ncbi:hypothetical protein H6P81_002977 [Aristolochia fimbriata]|uniref:Uncharacterized protein n=1 Tax=Aristolochia fimbriata TaxID=158543 RepID=A0AAV7FD26_ARIFI|nr:hypothetical protein H6P81_002977 [Aristolochia fimbriata]
MATEEERQLLVQSRRSIVFRWPLRRKRATSFPASATRKKRRKLPSIRLGKRRAGGSFLVKIFRRIRLRWLRLHYSLLLKRLKAFYSTLVRDLIEAGATMEAIQSRIMMETYFSVPVMPVTVASIPSHVSSPRSRLAKSRE